MHKNVGVRSFILFLLFYLFLFFSFSLFFFCFFCSLFLFFLVIYLSLFFFLFFFLSQIFDHICLAKIPPIVKIEVGFFCPLKKVFENFAEISSINFL